MPSKRHSTAADTREPSGSRSPAATATETTPRPAPAPRPPRGAAAIPAPRKSELHHVSLPPRPLPTQEQIARRAYEIWVQSGCVAGRDRENWTRAELELMAGCSAESAQQG